MSKDIAIIGMACRFPGACDYRSYWHNLAQGINSVREITPDRWDADAFYSPNFEEPNRSTSKWYGQVEDIDRFDHRFFKISPREARNMDPQQRILLQQTWSCIEDAGVPLNLLQQSRTAVHVAVMGSDYRNAVVDARIPPDSYTALGNIDCIMANRISYLLGFNGPSLSIDAACASSLVALHLSSRSLRDEECDYGLVAASVLHLHSMNHFSFSKSRMLSPEGRCKTFDKDANGYVPGEGIGVLLLQPLDKALAMGHHIHGVLEGTAMNHGGKAVSITAPRVEAQRDVIRAALKAAGVGAQQISYMEAHGTGTSLGDPIEVEALTLAYRQDTDLRGFCAIGSAKSNIGHLEAAAGLAGFIKLLLMMRHNYICPTLNIKALNPIINFAASPFEVALQGRPWEVEQTRRAGISAFGFGGVNAHAIVRQHEPAVVPAREEPGEQLFVLSAKTQTSLQSLLGDWSRFVKGETFAAANFGDISGTLLTRQQMDYRFGRIVANKEALAAILDQPVTQSPSEHWCLYCCPPIWQGYPENVYPPLALHLQRVRDVLAAIDETLAQSFTRTSWPESQRPLFSFMLAYGQSQALLEAGFTPQLIAGEGQGHWLALTLAGMIRLQDALLVLADRKALGALRLKRPLCTFYNPLSGHPIRPMHIDADYLKELRGLLKVCPEALSFQLENARLISESQFTFKKFLEEWSHYISHAGSDLGAMLQDPNFCTEADEARQLLLLTVLQSSMIRLNRKWNLTPSWKTTDPYFAEFAQWVMDGVMSKENCVAYLLDPEADLEAMAVGMEQKQHNIGNLDAYPLLRSRLQYCDDLPADRLSELLIHPASNPAMGTASLVVGNPNEIVSHAVLAGSAFSKRHYLQNLLDLWNRGVHLQWNQIKTQPHRVVNLPTYHFEGERFWLPHRSVHNKKTEEPPQEPRQNQAVCFRPVWQQTALVSDVDRPPTHALVFANHLEPQLQKTLAAVHTGVTMVEESLVFALEASGHVRIHPEREEDYTKLLQHLEDQYRLEHGLSIYYFVNKTNAGNEVPPALQNLFYLCKALVETTYAVVLLAVTRSAFKVTPEDRVEGYRNGALSGLAKTVNLELPRLHFKVLDLAANAPVPLTIVEEMSRDVSLVAWRENLRYTRHMKISSPEAASRPVYQPQKTYLIVGGATGLGYLLAQDIAGTPQVKLALLGRSPCHNIQEQLAVLRGLGTRTEYFQADITDATGMAVAIGNMKKQFGPIHGVVHSAGVLRDKLLREKTWDDFKTVLLPKLSGTEILDHLTRGEPLDFFVLFSSIVSLTGNVGQSDYTAANAYQDGLAHHRNSLGLPGKTLSVNWSLWQGGGMGRDEGVVKFFKARSGILSPQTGLAALRAALACNHTELAVCGNDQAFAPPPQQTHRIQAPIKSRQEFVVQLTEMLGAILGMEVGAFNTNSDLRDYGLDSVAMMEFSERIKRNSGIEFNAALLYEYSSLDQIGDYLSKHHANQTEATRVEPVLAEKPIAPPDRHSAPATDKIAIIGMSGRLPESDDLDRFWDHLYQGHDLISEIPANRWDWRAVEGDPSGEHNLTRARWGGFIKDIDAFDAGFFKIPPSLAARMDPQQRILIEEVWHTLEDAGIKPSALMGSKTGLFVGVSNDDYLELMVANNLRMDAHTTTGTYSSMVPNRISFLLGFHGPSVAVNTACSSSLVAVSQAISALREGDCDLALAAGVNALIVPRLFFALSHGGMLSADGRCKTFDAAADGYVRGEGMLAIALMPLANALAQGKRIHGIIRGCATNHGGFANSLTSPNPLAQAELLKTAWRRSGIRPDRVSYIEAHGTGTSLGDPIEINGLKRAFEDLYEEAGLPQPKQPHCALGSVKTHVGHLESAAGLVGLIKVLLAMRHGYLPGNLHQNERNPMLNLQGTPFEVLKDGRPWLPAEGSSLVAGVSSFGFGGANAHVVLESYAQQQVPVSNQPVLVVLSARTEASLRTAAQRLLDHLERNPRIHLQALAYTLQEGRDAMQQRLACVVDDLGQLRARLQCYINGQPTELIHGAITEHDTDLFDGKAGTLFLDTLLQEGDLDRLSRLWVRGFHFPWSRLYGQSPPIPVSLPGYAFARDKHWLKLEGVAAKPQTHPVLHPLLHRNTSTLERVRFQTTLNEHDFFMDHHRIDGTPILPGVAYLEAARAAGSMALNREINQLEQLVWRLPLTLSGQSRDLTIELVQAGAVTFEVLSPEGIHAQGQLSSTHLTRQCLDVEAIRARCSKAWDAETIYAEFNRRKLNYGTCFQTVRQILVGQGESLASLELPAGTPSQDFVLNPALLDGALQSLLGLLKQEDAGATHVPFAMDCLHIHAPLPPHFQVHATLAEGSSASMPCFNLSLFEEDGTVLVHISGFSVRALIGAASASAPRVVQPAQPPATDLTLLLREATANLLHLPLETVEPDIELRDFGLDNISLTELTTTLNRRLNLELSPSLLFDVPTLADLAEQLEAMIAPQGSAEPMAKPTADMNALLVEEAAELLGLPATVIDLDTELREFGFDSITLTELTTRINHRLDLSLSPALLFDFPNLGALATHLQQETQGALCEPGPPTAVPVEHVHVASSGWDGQGMEPVAIIGMAAHLPGSEDVDQFWDHLIANEDLIGEIPADRWDWRKFEGDPNQEGNQTNIRWGGFISDVAGFDAAFFGISDLEATLMDPQQRLFLQTAWAAAEEAGYPPEQLHGSRTGVFVGVGSSDYLDVLRENHLIEAHTATGWSHAMVANRISFLWNLRGPSEPVDTACSSSLTAVHRAIAALHSGDCDQAIVGGVNVIASPWLYISFSKAGMLCADGRCKPFDNGANGYVRGEGVAAMMLKPLPQALADGDHIHGLVRGSAVNHGGLANSLTAPNASAQAEVIVAAHRQAAINPTSLGYLEAHGTGTPLGDPIEINGFDLALKQLYQEQGLPVPQEPHCVIGSVKANIGHLETAAGMAGVIKVLLAMKHRKLPGNPHLQQVNKHIRLPAFARLAYVTQDWQAPTNERGTSLPLRAGVSSFGFGGANAHVVLEAWRQPVLEPTSVVPLFVLSARDETRLQAYALRLVRFLNNTDLPLDAILANLQHTRQAMTARVAIVVENKVSLLERLSAFSNGRTSPGLFSGRAVKSKTQPAPQSPPTALAQAWVKGERVDWLPLTRRISLPTYPFEQRRFWPTDLAEASHFPMHYYTRSLLPAQFSGRVFEGPVLAFATDQTLPKGWTRLNPADLHAPARLSTILQAYEGQKAIALVDLTHKGVDESARAWFHCARVMAKTLPKVGCAMGALVSDPLQGACATLMKVIANELRQFSGTVLENGSVQQLAGELGRVGVRHLRVQDNQLLEYRTTPLEQTTPGGGLATASVCLITGGAGGLGEIVALHLAKRRARLLLTGRSPESDKSRKLCEAITAAGGQAIYCQADVTRQEQMEAAVAAGVAHFGQLNAVFHAAGIIADGLLLTKDPADFDAVIAPKIKGTEILERVTRNQPLSHFVLFSSAAAPIGNPGQCDYAVGNAFMDAFAANRKGPGRAVSINWPLWENGGMGVDEAFLKRFVAETGLVPLPTAQGLAALDYILEHNTTNAIPLYGDSAKITGLLAPARIKDLEPAQADRVVAAEPWLIAIIAQALKIKEDRIDPAMPFGEYGVDSFLTLKIVHRLEKEVGTLPKSLLFEYGCINDLAAYFIANHNMGVDLALMEETTDVAVSAAPAPGETSGKTRLLRYAQLDQDPRLAQRVQQLLEEHDGEASVSRGTRDISPYLFFDDKLEGFFNLNRDERNVLAYAFTGPESAFASVAANLLHWCRQQKLTLNILGERRLEGVEDCPFSATPFGATQRIHNLQTFSLKGNRMRRLRYLVNKFARSGNCQTREYQPGEPATQAIAEVIDAWCASKTQVNPLIARVKQEILQGTLPRRHRIFLTYLNNTLQNAILITRLNRLNGYMMDLEFYARDMPLGGLEFAIANIIEQLQAEGCLCYSLGGTYGPQIEPSPNADPSIVALFAQMREADDFGEGNYQFKNKFRPQNTSIYICRPCEADPQTISDILLMIADPDAFNPPEPEAQALVIIDRAAQLAQAHWNPMHLDAARVEHDLKTDSWAQLSNAHISSHLQQLDAASAVADAETVLRDIFPFQHVWLAASGRAAEQAFYAAMATAGKQVPQNLLFPSGIFAQLNNGLTPKEVPQLYGGDEPFLGNLDIKALAEALSCDDIALVCVELCSNGRGGYPVSLANLAEVHRLTKKRGVPLVIDATRILDNALMIQAHEPGQATRDPRDICHDICARADYITASLAKNFAIDGGGLVASNHGQLFKRLSGQAMAEETRSRLSKTHDLFVYCQQQIDATRELHRSLKAADLPVLEPAAPYCVVLDSGRIPAFAAHPYPQQALLIWLYEHLGIRGGMHACGMLRDTYLNRCIRLAIPFGLQSETAGQLGRKIVAAFKQQLALPQIKLLEKGAGFGGEAQAKYTREGFMPWPATPTREAGRDTSQCQTPTASEPIAVVGIAGTYPKAANLEQLWQNLTQGLDAVTQTPPQRPCRTQSGTWGGFIEDIDAFDALFFNISPREAEQMDPQERLFLQCAWSAVEDAGHRPEDLADLNVGVYAGAVWSFYQVLGTEESHKGNPQTPNSFHWSIANRVSYCLNLSGPSLTLDTACSSSLTAIHLACEALGRGDIQAAIAGGVNLDLHPGKRAITAAGGTLSPQGRCFTFSDNASGYVAGEGVGALLLKPLSAALAAGNPIHALIRGTAANHGGRTSGFVVPNPAAQARVISQALEKAQVDARSITYIEAHGTGTKLGDPVEIDGLSRAFAAFTDHKRFCAIGSIKTNIGHLEAAAGIAGVSKIIAQMAHARLVPSLHAQPANPFIDFAQTPFVVQETLADWLPYQDQPLRAGLSSFGAGGSNVHMIFEAYPKAVGTAVIGPQLVVLSGRDQTARNTQAVNLLAHLRQHAPSLADVAYTLCHGRCAHDYRLAMVVTDLQQLKTQLEHFINGRTSPLLFSGKAKRVNKVQTPADLKQCAGLWVKGQIALPMVQQAQRICLPTYPFAKRRFWIDQSDSASLHPLVDLQEGPHHFIKQFDANQFVFRDHIVEGLPTLPGVGYLEMAWAAARLAGSKPTSIKNHVWAAAINPESHGTIHMMLSTRPDGLGYEITTGRAERVVHAQGRMVLDQQPQAPAALDPDAIMKRLTTRISREACYASLKEQGLTYGNQLKAIVWCLRNAEEQLTRLELPQGLETGFDHFKLHPALLDGAVQSVVGLLLEDGVSSAYLPFVLGELVVYKPLTRLGYAHILRKPDSAAGSIKKFDIRLIDERGEVLLAMHDFSLKAVSADPERPYTWRKDFKQEEVGASAAAPGNLLVFDADSSRLADITARSGAQHITLVTPGPQFLSQDQDRHELDPKKAEHYPYLLDALCQAGRQPDHIMFLWPLNQPASIWSLFHLLQAFYKTPGAGPLRLLYAHGGNPEDRAVTAFTRTLQHEHPGLSCCNLSGVTAGGVLLQELLYRGSDEVIYRNDVRHVGCLKPLSLGPHKPIARAGGVYLITGGGGGLGLIFARHLAACEKVTLVLVGRRPIEELTLGEELKTLGPRVIYHSCDISDEGQLHQVMQRISEQVGAITGVIHAAGLLCDAYFMKKQPEAMAAVLAPKLQGTLNLDAATRSHKPDFFVCCSSLAAVPGNPGQCDYAYANAFMDAFCAQRQASGRGRSLSINWPLWRDGGMGVDAQTEKMLARTTGMVPLETSLGLRALELGLASDETQLIVVDGELERIQVTLGLTQAKAKPVDADTASLNLKAAQAAVVQGITQILKLNAEDIENDEDLGRYGFDSISFTDFTNYLNETFNLDLTPVIFYEYDTVNALLGHLAEEHAERLPEQFRGGETVVKETQLLPQPTQHTSHDEPMAVVGMAGVMPGSRDLDAFWEHLQRGDDLISEIPSDRWDWRTIYGDPLTEPGKTNIKWGGFMPTIENFDADFFGISPREAVIMDPQQRMFLEIVWKTLEDAGYACKSLNGSATGLFVGSGGNDYHDLLVKHQVEVQAHTATGMMHSVLANRVSYLLGLRGPSEPVETACSSSLVALHRAIAAIRSGDCQQALVGGINMIACSDLYVGLAKASMLCEDGRCKTFDAGANGYVRGEGIGAIFIKPLSQARADRDHVIALVRGSAVNHGGNANSLTSPNLNAQAEVLMSAYQRASIDPSTVGFIEAHGTGTSLGDPIEINGLKKAFRQLYQAHNLPQPQAPHCYIGSVKTNVGHLELASGMAGLLKVLLALKHQTLPGNLHMKEQNPYIQLQNTPFQLLPATIPWPQIKKNGREQPRRAGVSSFGFGGVNAHVVLEEAPPAQQVPPAKEEQLFLLSARNKERLAVYVTSMLAFLDNPANASVREKMALRLRNGLREELGKLLDVPAEDIDPREDFSELGLDGLMFASLSERMKQRFDLDMTLNDLLTHTTLDVVAEQLASRYQHETEQQLCLLRDLAFTSQTGRDAHAVRLALVVSSLAQLRNGLLAWQAGEPHPHLISAATATSVQADQAIQEPNLRQLAALWVSGERIDWADLWRDTEARRTAMPSYPFEPKRYWFTAKAPTSPTRRDQLQLNPSSVCFKQHVIGGKPMLPGALSLVLLQQFSGANALADMLWQRPVEDHLSALRLERQQDTLLMSSAEGEHLSARVVTRDDRPAPMNLEQVSSVTTHIHQVAEFYQRYKTQGIAYGPVFKPLTDIRSGGGMVQAWMKRPAALDMGNSALHPSLLDAAFHAAAALEASQTLFVPYALGSIHIYGQLPHLCRVVLQAEDNKPHTPTTRHFSITICNGAGEVLVLLRNFTVRAIQPQTVAHEHPFIARQTIHPFIDQYVTS